MQRKAVNETVEKKIRTVQQTLLTTLPCRYATPCGSGQDISHILSFSSCNLSYLPDVSHNSEDYGNIITTELRGNEMVAVASVMVRVACCVKQ